jgi:hypothetical protein
VDLIVGTQKFHQVPDYLDNLRAAQAAGVPLATTIASATADLSSSAMVTTCWALASSSCARMMSSAPAGFSAAAFLPRGFLGPERAFPFGFLRGCGVFHLLLEDPHHRIVRACDLREQRVRTNEVGPSKFQR